MKKVFAVLLVILLAVFLTACSSPQKEDKIPAPEEEDEIIEEPMSESSIPSREALYTYNDKPPAMDLLEVDLLLNSEPLLLHQSYVRLVGVVSGGKPMALIEVSGKGLCVGAGEKVGDYRVISISEKEVKLKKEGGRQQ